MKKLLAILLVLSVPTIAQAQREDTALLLAQICTNEAGFDGTADCLAITAMSIRQARLRHMTLPQYLRSRFRRALAPANERRNRPWIANLNRTHEEPSGCNRASQPWSARRSQWVALLDLMDRVVAQELIPRCNAQTWGSKIYDRENIERILANGGYIVDCGNTKNVFLRFH